MTTASLAQSHSYAMPRRRKLFARVPMLAWNVLAVAAIVAVGAAYLAQVNKTLSASYEMNDVQKRVDAASTTVRANQIRISEFGTVDNLTAQAAAIGMVPTSGIEYVSVANSGVARR